MSHVLMRYKTCFEFVTLLRLANLHVTGTTVSMYEGNRRTYIDVRIMEKPYWEVTVYPHCEPT